MLKTSSQIKAAILISVFTPLLAFAQDADAGGNPVNHKWANILWAIAPFIILAILFWFIFHKQVKNQQNSPLVKRHQDHLDAQEQHMKRMEQLLERVAVALEKDKP